MIDCKTGLFLIFAILANACGHRTTFPREDGVLKLSEVLNISPEHKTSLVILQTRSCGACTDEVLSFINGRFRKANSFPVVIVHSSRDSSILSRLSGFQTEDFVFVEPYQLGKMGLDLSKDMVFILCGNQILYWEKITSENFNLIEKKINKNLVCPGLN